MAKKDIRNGVRWQLGVIEVRDSQGFETPFGWAGSPAHRGPGQPTDHIRYSRETGFSGITPKDKEQWVRKYPRISDFELAVEEGHEWVSRHWAKANMAEARPREFLDWWLAGEWVPLNPNGYKEPETIYNPEQLSDFIEQYFKAGELIERLTRGKHDGLSDSLASKHYDKALGHAVKLRDAVPESPKTPEPMGKPHIDLRRLQEWCIECATIAGGLYAKVTKADIDRPLAFLRELDGHLKSGFPKADGTALAETQKQVWGEVERLLKVIGELDEPSRTFGIAPADRLAFKAQHWFNRANWDHECQSLLVKMQEYGIRVPKERTELAEMLAAAEWMAKTDWDKVREITKKENNGQPASTPIDGLSAQMRILMPAKTTEEKVGFLAWKRYRQADPDYDAAFHAAEERMASLYDGAVAAVNSQQDLLKIVYLREAKLESTFKRLHGTLFGTPARESTPGEALQETIGELEAIRESIKGVPSASDTGGPVEASMFSDPAMNIPAIEEVSEVIQKLVGLKQEIERIRNAVENGEDPEKVKVEAQKAEEFFRKLRDTLAANRPFGPVKIPPSLKAKIDALRDSGEFPIWTEMHLVAIQGISQTYKGLPLSILRRLRTEVISRIWRRDSEEVIAGLTVRDLKNCMGIVEKAEELELMRRVRAETDRVFQEVDLALCPYQEFFQQEFGSGPVQSADASSLNVLIHQYKRVKRRLEVKARHQTVEQRQEKREQNKKQPPKPRAKITASQTSRKFQPWAKPGDACFILDHRDNIRLLFHFGGKYKDLCLGSNSHALDLMTFLANGSLRPDEIRTKLSLDQTKPSKVVARANETLNRRIAEKGFTGVPANAEFLRRDKFNSYLSTLTIHPSIAEFERGEREQPREDDR